MVDVIAFISFFLGASWRFFSETLVPGFDFTIGQFFIAYFLANFGLRVLFSMLAMRISSGNVAQGVSDVRERWGKR